LKGDVDLKGKITNKDVNAGKTGDNIPIAINDDSSNIIQHEPFFDEKNAYVVYIAKDKAIFVNKESGKILGPVGEGTLGIILYGGDPKNGVESETGRLIDECAIRIPRLLNTDSFLNFNLAEMANYEGKQAKKFKGTPLLLGADDFFRLNKADVFTKIPTGDKKNTYIENCYIGFYLASNSTYKICLVSKDDFWPQEFKDSVKEYSNNLFEEIKKSCDNETEQFDNLLFFPKDISNRRKNGSMLQTYSREGLFDAFRQKNINGWWFNLPVAIYPWMSCDLERVLTAYVDSEKICNLKVWDLESGQELATLNGHSNSVNGVAVTPNAKWAVSVSEDKTLKIWDLESNSLQATLFGHFNSVEQVAITPDGKRAVSASRDKTLKVWDLESGSELATLSGHSEWVNGVAVTSDGKCAVSASGDQTVKVWDLDTYRERELANSPSHSEWVNGVAITPDDKRVVSASMDKTLKVWDLKSGHELATLNGHSNSVNCVAITPDGKRAVSASRDKTLKVWDLDTYRELATLSGHSNSVNGVAITPDGKLAVSASGDKTLKVWNLDTYRELTTLSGHSNWINEVAITLGGRRAISASHDLEINRKVAKKLSDGKIVEELSDRKVVEDLMKWELSEWLKLFLNLCNGILNLHDKGCIHGDPRPANIMTKLSVNTKTLSNSFRWIDIALGYDIGSSPLPAIDISDSKKTTIVPKPLGGGRTTPFYAPERTEGLEYEDADSIRLAIFDNKEQSNKEDNIQFQLTFLYKDNTFAEPRVLQLKKNGIELCELGTLNKNDRIQVKEYIFVVEEIKDTEIIISRIFELALDRLLIDISFDRTSRENIVETLNNTSIPRYRVFRQWSEATDIYGLGVTIFYILFMRGLSRIKQSHPSNLFIHREAIFSELISLLRNKSFLKNTLHIIFKNGYSDFDSLCTQRVLLAEYTRPLESGNTPETDAQKISSITDNILHIDNNLTIILYGVNHCRGLFVQILYFILRCLWRTEDLSGSEDERKLFENYKFVPFCANKIRIEDNRKRNESAGAAYNAMDKIQSEVSRVALSAIMNSEHSELEQQNSEFLLSGRIDQVIDLNQRITDFSEKNAKLSNEIKMYKDILDRFSKEICVTLEGNK
jgi:WD40 repeat protein